MQIVSKTLRLNTRSSLLTGLRQLKRGERAVTVALLLITISLCVFSLQTRYRVVYQSDYSVRFTLAIVDRESLLPEKGEYVAFNFLVLPGDARYGRPFVKKVGCLPGELLENRGREFFCNGELIGRAKEYSREGKFLKPFEYRGIIPSGNYFAVGEVVDSYDSKFWGFVRQEWITGTVKEVI